MTVDGPSELPLTSQEDVVAVRQVVRARSIALGLTLVSQTKLVTAASELARNAVVHGGGGKAWVETITVNGKTGVRLIVQDTGPGIADINRAMQDGYTTGGGLGLGLGGAKRLVSDFEIISSPGNGTRVTITRWKGDS